MLKRIKFEYRIVMAYLIIGALWILFSDKVLLMVFEESNTLSEFQTYKGLFYVIITGVLFYLFLKKHLNRLRAAEHQARENDQLKTAFIQNISHEIRTPMNGIVGFAGLLNDENLTSHQKKQYLDIITSSSEQLLNVVNEVLDISMIESGNVAVHESHVHLNHLFDEIKLSLQSELRNGIAIFINKGLSDDECLIRTDVVKLRQILGNLLNNAKKFTQTGSVSLSYTLNKNELEFCVEDTGIGLDPEVLPRIFERFYQADTGNKRIYQGVGLGLAICKGNVELLKGRIWVRSERNTGSKFYFTLPYQPAHTADFRTPVKSTYLLDLQDYTILVAEDEESNYKYISELLKDTGARILRAGNGEEAVSACRNNPDISLILMDIRMPVMSGIQAVKKIRTFYPSIPVIAQTAFAHKEEKGKVLQAGFNEYLVKPFNKEQILRIIEKYIPKSEQ